MYNNRMTKVSIGDDLSRRRPLPENKKYANVKPVTNSGASMAQASPWDELNYNVRYRKNEHFRRIKAQTLASLLQAEDDEVSPRRLLPSAGVRLARRDSRKTLRGRTDRSVVVSSAIFSLSQDSPQVLVLDVRTLEEYESCHVRGAVSFPIAMLSRAMNPFISVILEFANREPEKIIVLYDTKEKQSVLAGNLFFEKGIDNVFVLSRGMNALVQAPSLCDLLVGDVPMAVPDSAASSLASTRAPSLAGTPRKQVSTPRALRPYETKVRIKLLSSSLRKSKPSGWH